MMHENILALYPLGLNFLHIYMNNTVYLVAILLLFNLQDVFLIICMILSRVSSMCLKILTSASSYWTYCAATFPSSHT